MSAKVCRGCNTEKPLGDFSPDARHKDGKQSQCKACKRAQVNARRAADPEAVRATNAAWRATSQRRHGMTQAEKREWLDRVGWQCEVCGDQFHKPASAYVDHDHSCCPGSESCGGCVRGLLCYGCNTALGAVRDSADRLATLIHYLDRYDASKP